MPAWAGPWPGGRPLTGAGDGRSCARRRSRPAPGSDLAGRSHHLGRRGPPDRSRRIVDSGPWGSGERSLDCPASADQVRILAHEAPVSRCWPRRCSSGHGRRTRRDSARPPYCTVRRAPAGTGCRLPRGHADVIHQNGPVRFGRGFGFFRAGPARGRLGPVRPGPSAGRLRPARPRRPLGPPPAATRPSDLTHPTAGRRAGGSGRGGSRNAITVATTSRRL